MKTTNDQLQGTLCHTSNNAYTDSTGMYSAVHGFWPLEKQAELAEGPIGCGALASGRCLIAWDFSVARSLVQYLRRWRKCLDQT